MWTQTILATNFQIAEGSRSMPLAAQGLAFTSPNPTDKQSVPYRVKSLGPADHPVTTSVL
jgi:hypothetical protein